MKKFDRAVVYSEGQLVCVRHTKVGAVCVCGVLARTATRNEIGARGMIVLCTIMVPAPKLVSQKNERNNARLMQQQQHRASSFKTGTYLHGDQLRIRA
jgi:hypothetical protein